MQLPNTHLVSNKLKEKLRLCLVVSFYLIKIKMAHHSVCRPSPNLQRVPVSIRLIIASGLVSMDGVIKSFSLQSQEEVVADSPDLKPGEKKKSSNPTCFVNPSMHMKTAQQDWGTNPISNQMPADSI